MALTVIGIIIGLLLCVLPFVYAKPPVSTYKEWLIALGVFAVVMSLGWTWLALGLFVIVVALLSKEPWIARNKIFLILFGIFIAVLPFVGWFIIVLGIIILVCIVLCHLFYKR